MSVQASSILLVEDDRADQRLIERALHALRIANEMEVVEDGDAALAWLRARAAAERLPSMVLLDLNLPGLSGHEVLAEIRADPALKALPVVVLTTSSQDEDVRRSYELGANSFLTKPPDMAGLQRMMASLGDFWFQIARLPESP